MPEVRTVTGPTAVPSSFVRKLGFPFSAPCVNSLTVRRLPAHFRQPSPTQSVAATISTSQTSPYLLQLKPLSPETKTINRIAPVATHPTSKTSPYLLQTKPVTATSQTTNRIQPCATLCTSTTNPYITENKRLTSIHKTLIPPSPSSETKSPNQDPLPRTPNRSLFHRWVISPYIRYLDTNGLISKPNHINASRSSCLILWSWPPSCNPQECELYNQCPE